MPTVSHEGYVRRQALHLKLVQPNLDWWLVLQGVDNLSLVKNPPGTAELIKVVREQSAKLLRGAADLRFRHGLFKLA